MDEKYIRLVLDKLNNIVEQGIELPLYWQYEKDGGQPNNTEEDKVLTMLTHKRIIASSLFTLPDLISYYDEEHNLKFKSEDAKEMVPKRQVRIINYERLEGEIGKYGAINNSNGKNSVELILDGDNEIVFLLINGEKRILDINWGTKVFDIFREAYEKDGVLLSKNYQTQLKHYGGSFRKIMHSSNYRDGSVLRKFIVVCEARRLQVIKKITDLPQESIDWLIKETRRPDRIDN